MSNQSVTVLALYVLRHNHARMQLFNYSHGAILRTAAPLILGTQPWNRRHLRLYFAHAHCYPLSIWHQNHAIGNPPPPFLPG